MPCFKKATQNLKKYEVHLEENILLEQSRTQKTLRLKKTTY